MNDLPAGWQFSTLGDVCEKPQYGWTTSAKQIGEIKLLRTTDLSRGEVNWQKVPFCQEVPADLEKYLVKDDDIFISRAGSVGFSAHVKVAPVNSVFASYLIRVRSNGAVLPQFLALFLNSPMYWDQVSEASAGIALLNINAVKIKNLTIPVPPVDVQQRIVETLEDHLSRLEKGYAEVREGINKIAALRRSILRSAFSGDLLTGLDPGGFKPLGELGVWRGGGTPSKSNQSFWRDGVVPWLTAKDMIGFRTSITQDLITEAAVSGSSASLIPPGAVVVVARSGILERKLPVTVTEVEVTVNQDMKALTCRSGINPDWVAYGLLAFEQEILRTCRKAGTTVANLNFQDFLRFEIPVPSLEIQQQILEALDLHLGEVDSTLEVLRSTENQISVMRRSLLHTAFSGQLTNEEPND